MSNEREPDVDHALTVALNRFVRRVAGESVHVACTGGVASITGSVTSATTARAVEDLIRWHDGVERIESDLRVEPSTPAPASNAN